MTIQHWLSRALRLGMYETGDSAIQEGSRTFHDLHTLTTSFSAAEDQYRPAVSIMHSNIRDQSSGCRTWSSVIDAARSELAMALFVGKLNSRELQQPD
jgi:hypothetical protein